MAADIPEKGRAFGKRIRRAPQLGPCPSEPTTPVERFLAGIAHEMRNPIEGLNNALYLLRKARIPADASQLVDVAEAELKRISQIVKHLLDEYKGHLTQTVTVNLSEVLESTLAFYAQKIQFKKVRVERQYSSRGGIEALPGQMRQVFTNLIINALEALPLDQGRLIVRLYESRDWNNGRPGIRVTIADTGLGIAPGNIKKIFSGTYTSKGEKGTGVGLWMVKRIVDSHSGSIRVRSSITPEQSWTCFSIFLPSAYSPTSTPEAGDR